MEEVLAERVILVIEANPAHINLIEAGLSQSAVKHRTVAIADGKDVMDFLHRQGEYSDAPRPDLILLDLNIPTRDGREILAEMKANPQFRRIPVIILTAANYGTEDVLKTYKLQGNCYVSKSNDPDQLAKIVKRIEEFWLGIVTLPLE